MVTKGSLLLADAEAARVRALGHLARTERVPMVIDLEL